MAKRPKMHLFVYFCLALHPSAPARGLNSGWASEILASWQPYLGKQVAQENWQTHRRKMKTEWRQWLWRQILDTAIARREVGGRQSSTKVILAGSNK